MVIRVSAGADYMVLTRVFLVVGGWSSKHVWQLAFAFSVVVVVGERRPAAVETTR